MLMNQPKRGGIFGQRPPMIDHPNGMMNPVGTGEGLPQIPMNTPKKGGFFGQGGFGRYLAGGIADGIAAASGMQPGFANSIENQRIMEMYKQRQDAELAQYERKQQIEAQYPKPYRWESNNGSLMELGPDGQARTLYQDPTPKINWVRADNGDGTFTMVPVGQEGPVSGAPASPVGKLKPFGGGTGSGSGNFPR